MDFFNLLTMIGGLALFLYGMNTMGNGLETMAGGKLEQILEKMTSSSIKAVLLGAGVTATIQSSSATTVMVIGFVNSGIMKLRQAIGVIYGAKIGTTITAWLLSLTGISSDNFFVRLFKPSSFSPVLAAIGIYFVLFSKKEKKKNIGVIFLGFAILMFGMESMSDAMRPLADMPEFRSMLTLFSNPILALLVGVILTAVIQSSSASIGILQAMSLTGAIPFSMALPMIMGQNVGTCVTAMLSSIGTSKNAKRAAVAHLISTVIGAIVCMIIFYLVNSIVNFTFLDMPATPAGVAMIHTSFNIIIVSILTPCIPLVEKLICMIVKDDETVRVEEKYEHDFDMLDEKFLHNPAYAILKAKETVEHMAIHCKNAFTVSVELLNEYDEKKADYVVEMESRIDKYEDVLGAYLLKICGSSLSQRDNMMASMLLHCIGDLERISDHAVNITEAVQEMRKKEVSFSSRGQEELRVYTNAVVEILERAVDVFNSDDAVKAREIEPLEDVIDDLNVRVKNRHIKRLTNGECTIELGFILSDITTNLERVSDHCSNIAVYVMQLEDEEMEKHSYIDSIDKDSDELFKELFKSYKDKYQLPKQK